MKLLLATTNQGKLREYKELLQQSASAEHCGLSSPALPELIEPSQLGLHVDVEESGETFAENAVIKAKAYAAASGLYAMADDSGLEIDALHGQPGIRSARYAGPTDADRIQAVLTKMQAIARPHRTAHFRCVVAVASPNGETWTSHGSCDGIITTAPRGRQGFGYDPIFYLPSLRRTMAQLPRATKNQISHRAAAFRDIYPIIRQLLTNNIDP